MNKTQIIPQKQPLALAGLSRHHSFRSLLALCTATVFLPLVGHESKTFGQTVGANLKSGDIVYSDSGDAIQGGFIFKLDPQSGQRSILSQGGYLGFFGYPNGVAIDSNGQVIVSNEACLLRIDPQTGSQTLIRDVRGSPGAFWGIALDPHGNLLVAAENAILRVN